MKVAVAYRLRGERIDTVPARVEDVDACEPEYVSLPGWHEGLEGLRAEAGLPESVRAYVSFVEAHLGVPVSVLSVGPGREQIIFRHDPYA